MSNNENTSRQDSLDALRRKIRLVVLLDSAERAGLIQLSIVQLHTFAYLANVLSPVWGLPALEGKLLKRRGSPFYPVLQHDLDRLVGTGVAIISNVSYVPDEDGRWRLEGSYQLNRLIADRIIASITEFESERRVQNFIQELGYALSALDDEEIEQATTQDATYADPLVDVGNVVDFGEWRTVNSSANAARYFEHLIPGGGRATNGEMLHLYVRHLHRRLHSGI